MFNIQINEIIHSLNTSVFKLQFHIRKKTFPAKTRIVRKRAIFKVGKKADGIASSTTTRFQTDTKQINESIFFVYVNTFRYSLVNPECNSFVPWIQSWARDNLFYFCMFILFEKPLFDERSRKNWVLLSQTTFAYGLQF